LPSFLGGGELELLTVILGIVLSIIYIIYEFKLRRNDIKYNLSTVSFPLYIVKLIVLVAAINIFTFMLAQYEGIPYILITLIALIIGYTFFMNKTLSGRHIYA